MALENVTSQRGSTMADGEECVTCGYQETVHKHPYYADPGHPPCGDFDPGYPDPLTQPPSDPCSCYPNCPTTTELVQVGVTEYDPDSNSSESSYREEKVRGPCRGCCRVKKSEEEAKQPLNHAIWVLFRDPKTGAVFAADIGS